MSLSHFKYRDSRRRSRRERTHHLHPKLMMTWQKLLFIQTAQKVKNGLALGVRVNAIVILF